MMNLNLLRKNLEEKHELEKKIACDTVKSENKENLVQKKNL